MIFRSLAGVCLLIKDSFVVARPESGISEKLEIFKRPEIQHLSNKQMEFFDKLFELKVKGQQLKSKGETKEAIKEFSKLMIMINHVFKTEGLDKETEFKLVKDLQIPTFLKLSSCYLQLNDELNKVIMFCSNVLDIDQSNSKAYYFRAKARYYNGDYDRALKDLNYARENDPNKHKYREFQSTVRKMKTADNSRHNLSIWTSIGKQLILTCKRRRQVM